MKKEKSVGCIIIDDNQNVLLVNEKERNFWGFPKGHTELGETEIETALREVKEETGIVVKINETKRYSLNYIIRYEIDKTTVLYIARPIGGILQKQESEIAEVKWCPINAVIDTLTFDNAKELFKKVMKDLNLN